MDGADAVDVDLMDAVVCEPCRVMEAAESVLKVSISCDAGVVGEPKAGGLELETGGLRFED